MYLSKRGKAPQTEKDQIKKDLDNRVRKADKAVQEKRIKKRSKAWCW